MLNPTRSRVITVIGVLIPLSGVGEAVAANLESEELAAAASEGGVAGRALPTPSPDEADPDAILPVSPGQPVVPAAPDSPHISGTDGEPEPAPGTVPVVIRPSGDNPKYGDSTFIGNAGWVAPGIMTSMSNSIWQESQTATDPSVKSDLNSDAVVQYMLNQSEVLKAYSDTLMTYSDNASTQNLLSVLAGGSFVNTSWSQALFETALSADVISRQINTAWTSKTTGGVYVSYTQLHDNANGTICNATHVGVRASQLCADTGVYYLNMLNTVDLRPTIEGPPGFAGLLDYGIMPWWPTSAIATAYRLMNPNGNVVPPTIVATNDSIFANYMNAFSSDNQYGLLGLIGQTPGIWKSPLW